MYQAPVPQPKPLRSHACPLDALIFFLSTLIGGGVLFLNRMLLEALDWKIVSRTVDVQTLGLIIIALGLVPGLVVGSAHYVLFWGAWSHATPWLHGSMLGWTLGACVFICATRVEHVVGHPLQQKHLGQCLMLSYAICGALTGFFYWRVYRTYQPGFARRVWRGLTVAGFILISAAGFFLAEAMLIKLTEIVQLSG